MSSSDEISVAVVVSRFNEAVTRRLLDGAVDFLTHNGIALNDIHISWVPGAFELPVVVRHALESGRFEFAVALGAVVRGQTPHFDFISSETTRGLGEAALTTGKPVGFGLLTCDTFEQAVARAGGAAGNKGAEAAEAALLATRAIREIDAAAQS